MRYYRFIVIIFAICAVSIAGCEAPSDERPEGWTDKTHGSSAQADYDTVFDQDTVKRIDLIFTSGDWQTMLFDMTLLCGLFGAGGGMGGMPMPDSAVMQPLVDACEGLEEGDLCSFPGIFGAVEGTCSDMAMMGSDLMCMRERSGGGGMPGGGIPGGEGLDLLSRDPVYLPCTIRFEGNTWEHVGVRFKGNSSLRSTWSSGSYKLPMRFDFDEFEDTYPSTDDQRFYGFKKLTMSSNWSDNSLIREKAAADIFREASVPSAMTAFYRVFVDYGQGPVYFGLYTMVEDPDGPMLDEQFSDGSGNLYKPDGSGATFGEFYEASFVKKTNEDEADWSDVISVFEALHADRGDPAAWRAGLEAVFDAEGFIRYLAVNNLIQNWDTYGIMAHNYYLYSDPGDGLLHWIPWDNNMSLSSGIGMGTTLSLGLTEVGEQWPLIRYLMDDPVYYQAYAACVYEAVTGPFSVEYTRQRYQRARELISPYVTGPEGEQPGYTLLQSAEVFEEAFSYLDNHVEQRYEKALAFLSQAGYDPPEVVITEIHYNPGPDQGDDEEYEFIEICNTGTEPADVSGYSFVRGIAYVFPEQTVIDPGEYIVMAKNSAAYSGNGYRVFQWSSGSLANGGEVIQLRDADSVQVDYVCYDDGGAWDVNADGGGPSLELVDSGSSNALAGNWQASLSTGGTPGRANSVAGY